MTQDRYTSALESLDFEVTIARDEGADRVGVSGELDIATAPLLEAKLHALGSVKVVLDLSGVHFIDSSGLRVILDAHAMFGERLHIVGASGQCVRLFRIAGVLDRLPLVRS